MKRQPSEFYLKRWEELANRLPERVNTTVLNKPRFTHGEFEREYMVVPNPQPSERDTRFNRNAHDFAERVEARRREELRQMTSDYNPNRITNPCNETPLIDPNKEAMIGKTVNIVVQNEEVDSFAVEHFNRMIREATMKELSSGIHPIIGARMHDELTMFVGGGGKPSCHPQERLVVQKGRQEGVATAYQVSNQKGTTMNINTIVNLASNNTDEFSKYDELPENLKKALKRKMKEKEETAADEAADTILQILELSEHTVKDRVTKIRSLRAQEKTVKESIEVLERCRAYGMKTQNFLPMAKHLGYNVSMLVADQKLLEIPADFKVDAK